MDIDHFKKINDTYGHLVGDEVLREFSQRLASAKRGDDLLCRYGGEEFTLILAETNIEEAAAIATQCNQAIGTQDFVTSAGCISVTVSIGVAQLPLHEPQMDAVGLLENADVQLYHAKESGRNRVCHA